MCCQTGDADSFAEWRHRQPTCAQAEPAQADEEAATASVDVPPSLSRVVLLASSMSGGAASAGSTSGRAHAVGKQRRTAAEWEVGDGTRGAYGHGPQELHDSFDPSVASLWEAVTGGAVGSECGSVSGLALCFRGVGARLAATSPINTLAGGAVRFSLSFPPDEALAADVAFEYKSIGMAWVQLERYSERSYAAAAYDNPNGASLVAWEGAGAGGFVMYAVRLPAQARSAATKFRWRQVQEQMTTVSHVAAWALDDVSVDVQADQPVVQLSTSSQQARSGGMLTVVIQLTQAVSGLDQSDVVVRNGTAAGLTRFKTKILGVGDLFTLLVRPAGGLGDAFNVSVHVPAGACHNHNKKPNLPSNTLVIPYKVARRSRAEMAFGPRPGPADAREVEAFDSDAQGVRPLKQGEEHPDKEAMQHSKMEKVFKNKDSVQKKLEEAQSVYASLLKQTPPPPQMMLDRLAREVEVLRLAQSSLANAEELLVHRTNMPRINVSAGAHEHLVLQQDMAELRQEREQTFTMMQEAQKLREQMLAEREQLRKDQEAVRLEAEAEKSRLDVQQKQQVASLQEAVREVMQEEHAKLHDEIMDEVYSSHDHDHHFEQEYHQDHHHHDHARQPLSAEEESLDLEDLQQSSAEFLLEDVPEGELVDGAYVSAVQQLVHGAGHGETWHHERDGLHSHHPPDHGPHYDHHEAASHSHWSHSHNIDSHAHASHYHTDHSHAEEAHHHGRHEPFSHAAPHSDGHELPTRLHHSHEDHLHNHGRSHGVAHHSPHTHPHHHDVESIHEEIHEQMDSLTAGRQDVQVEIQQQRADIEGMAAEAETMRAERERVAAERREALELEQAQRAQWAQEQRMLMDQMAVQHRALMDQTKALREERDALKSEHAVEESHDHGHHHRSHAHVDSAHHAHDGDHHHAEAGYEDAHSHHEHDAEHEALVVEERLRLEAERAELAKARADERKMLEELQAVRLQLVAEKERLAAEAQRELQEEKERMRLQREAEAQAREAWANEQRKFMEELMNQQRALKEQAEWISREHQQHGWSSAHDEHIAEGTRANDRKSDESDRGHGGIDEADEMDTGGMHRAEGLDIRIKNELDTEAESTLHATEVALAPLAGQVAHPNDSACALSGLHVL
eukprot:CAMPEP_0114232308 /NCGR_PEP_ID=MMETSP0058-20121206/4533_1 /TAXON_ID=36894 /ORGANISM="Pyramimonas parkeae, CCMP726" /LENGTH=1132 /DNA_ID=CAMNT_0001343765 /DNA_START=103 /DNA_END=3503 /DNA_ORIENTATION=+